MCSYQFTKMKNKKTVLITGGAVRIGREISRYFAQNSYDVVIHCNSSIREAEKLSEELADNYSGNFKVLYGNLLDDEFINKIFDRRKIDILINNASFYNNYSLENESLDNAKKQFELNFWVPYKLMLQFKEKFKNGSIINILDTAIYKNDLNSGCYLLSKKSLYELTKLAALQWAPDIRINGVAPGFVIPPAWLPSSKMEKSRNMTPMKKNGRSSRDCQNMPVYFRK